MGNHMEINAGSIEHAVQKSIESKKQGTSQGHIYEIKGGDGSVRYEFLTKEEVDTLKAAGEFLRKIATVSGGDTAELTLKISKHVGSDDLHAAQIAEKIFTSFKAIKEVQVGAIKEEAKQISDAEVLKICAKAQTILGRGGEGIARAEQDLEHPIQVDFGRKEFTVLLGSSGKIQAEGVAGKVESVIRVTSEALSAPKSVAGHFVHKTAKSGHEIDEEELRLTKKYQNGHEFTHQNERVLVVEAFDGDLNSQVTNPTNYTQSVHILDQLSKQLSAMHENNDTHLDLKSANILVRKSPDDSYTVQIADFGMSNKDRDIYGTFGFTSPEAITHFLSSLGSIRGDDEESDIVPIESLPQPWTKSLDQKKASDVYALGLVAIKIVTGEQPIWIEEIENSRIFVTEEDYCESMEIDKSELTDRDKSVIRGGGLSISQLEEAHSLQVETVSRFIEAKRREFINTENSDGHGKLLDLIGELLEPDPAKRLSIDQFREKINTLSKG